MVKALQDDFEIYSREEILRRIARYRGVKPALPPNGRAGFKKSYTLTLYDLARVAKIPKRHFWCCLAGTRYFGKVLRARVSHAIRLFDAGLVEKHGNGYRKHKIHDKPFAIPPQRMRVVIGEGGVSLTAEPQKAPPKGMPDFSKIFGGK